MLSMPAHMLAETGRCRLRVPMEVVMGDGYPWCALSGLGWSNGLNGVVR